MMFTKLRPLHSLCALQFRASPRETIRREYLVNDDVGFGKTSQLVDTQSWGKSGLFFDGGVANERSVDLLARGMSGFRPGGAFSRRRGRLGRIIRIRFLLGPPASITLRGRRR